MTKVVCDYERQRLKRLRLNMEFIEAKGYGDLASKIFEQKAKGIRVNRGGEGSTSDEDEEYTHKIVGDVVNDETSDNAEDLVSGRKKYIKKVPQKPLVKTGSMDEYVMQKQPMQKQRPQRVPSRPKASSMSEYVNQAKQKQELQQQKLVQVKVNPNQVRHPVNQMIGQQQKKQPPKKFCSPRALSAYRELRK